MAPRTMNEEKLIEAVRQFDCLWKVSAKVYRDSRAKENAWKAVARTVSLLGLLAAKRCCDSTNEHEPQSNDYD